MKKKNKFSRDYTINHNGNANESEKKQVTQVQHK